MASSASTALLLVPMWQGMSPGPGGDVGAASAGPDADVAGNPNGYHAMGLLDDLLLWHADDPPSASESLRNDRYLDSSVSTLSTVCG